MPKAPAVVVDQWLAYAEADLVAARGPAVSQQAYEAAVRLTPYATKPRYPGLGEVTADEVVEALAFAAEIRDAILAALAQEAL